MMFVERRGQMAPKLSPELEAVQEDALGRALARFEQRFSATHNALPATDSSRCIMRQQVCIQRFCAEELRDGNFGLMPAGQAAHDPNVPVLLPELRVFQFQTLVPHKSRACEPSDRS